MKKLYSYPITIWLTRSDNGVTDLTGRLTSNYSMIDSDFKIHKNSRSEVQFVVRDTDRKPIPLVGKTAEIIILNYDNDETMLERQLEIVDEYKGIAKLVTLETDTMDWQEGFYYYSVHLTDENLDTVPLYVDLDQNARSYFELLPNLRSRPRPVTKIDPRKFVPQSFGWQPQLGFGDTRMVSGVFAGDKEKNFQGTPEHHVVVTTDNFRGMLWIQYNDEPTITTFDNEDQHDWDDWTYIELNDIDHKDNYDFMNSTGTTTFVIPRSFQWFRIMYEPYRNQGKIVGITHEIKKGI